RLNVVDRLRQAELLDADRVGRGNLYAMVSHETNHLSVAFPLLVDSLQQTVLLFFSLVYLAVLSPLAFAVFLVAVAVGIAAYMTINRRFSRTMGRLSRQQGRLLDAIDSILRGAKELRLNSARGQAVEQAYRRLSRAAEADLVASGEHWAEMILLSSFVTYLMLGIVAYFFPAFVHGHTLMVFQLVPVLLFCISPLTKIVAQSPMFLRAQVGLLGILTVERRLIEAGGVSPADARRAAQALADFATIRYDRIGFTHHDENGDPSFTAGPLSLDLTRGEVVFLVGGNGSGKSTALRLLCGLYPAERGAIQVDGHTLTRQDVAGLRELFSAIFVDFHLFDRLYGAESIDPARVNDLLHDMGLGSKVRYVGGRFSTTSLSTGQRKRLALVAALLEDRPIYLFDEWSAEQDIHFRRYFYETLIPRLKAAGKLVVAVTHDERYWHVADRVVKLDLGAVVWDRPGASWEAST
ncbi:MAG: cyclic peptide export ABC transporter, partial [Magnetospirillum sp.]